MPENKLQNSESAAAESKEDAPSGDALSFRDVLTGGVAGDPCNVTASMHFRFDSTTGNTLVEVMSPDDTGAVTQQMVLQGIDLTSRGSLSDSQVIQLLLSQGKPSVDP